MRQRNRLTKLTMRCVRLSSQEAPNGATEQPIHNLGHENTAADEYKFSLPKGDTDILDSSHLMDLFNTSKVQKTYENITSVRLTFSRAHT